MNVVLVNPPVTRRERYGTLAPAGAYSPPLALCSLAAVVRALGHEAAIVDAPVEGLDPDQTVERVTACRPDLVGITSTTATFANAARLAESIKGRQPNVRVFAGGVHVSALPEETLAGTPAFDAVVIGEGEDTVADLLSAVQHKRPLREVPGIVFRENEAPVRTPARPLIQDLDRLPLPAWDLLKRFPDGYNLQAQSVARSPSISVCTSRGCAGRCTFCDRRVFGSRLRAHSAGYILNLLKGLKENYGVRDVQFEDDNFMLFRKRLFAFCDLLRESGLDLTWSCQARVDAVRPDVLEKMKESGCWMILYGIESASQKVLDAMGKGITVAQIERAIALTHRAGIQCKGFFITGFLNEDRESLAETYAFIKRCRLDDISNHYFCPFPGSESHGEVERYGRLQGDFSDMTFYRPVFIPNTLTEEDLVRHTKACYRAFYFGPRTLLRYLRRVRRPRDLWFFARSGWALLQYLLFRKQ